MSATALIFTVLISKQYDTRLGVKQDIFLKIKMKQLLDLLTNTHTMTKSLILD